MQSVTIVSETIEAVHYPSHIGYVSQLKVTSEIPKSLIQQRRYNKEQCILRKLDSIIIRKMFCINIQMK
ncbi:hypothetical protein ALC53_14049 [Atta colombica]|uniref:Uncharacterized protein n=1 Tax=Atta colombica TaxID=520822 RepID=A0A151HYK5_9HYME|nr:hypothetical protein ALC53_14049 [Atta colombica]